MPKTYDEYKKQAQDEYNPIYDSKVNIIKNALNSNLTALENQNSGINQQYDSQLDSQNRNNALMKSNYDAVNTERGLGRSTILTTGLAAMDDKNNRLLGDINKARGAAIGGVDAQKTTLTQNANTDLATLANDRESTLANLIRQYQQTDLDNEYRARQEAFQRQQFAQQVSQQKLDNDFRSQQFAYQQQQGQLDNNFRNQQFNYQQQQGQQAYDAQQKQAQLDEAYRQQELELQKQQLAASIAKAKSSSSGSGSGSKAQKSDDTNATWDALYAAVDAFAGEDFLKTNRTSIVRKLGNDVYQKMLKYVQDNSRPLSWSMRDSYKTVADQKAFNNHLADIEALS